MCNVIIFFQWLRRTKGLCRPARRAGRVLRWHTPWVLGEAWATLNGRASRALKCAAAHKAGGSEQFLCLVQKTLLIRELGWGREVRRRRGWGKCLMGCVYSRTRCCLTRNKMLIDNTEIVLGVGVEIPAAMSIMRLLRNKGDIDSPTVIEFLKTMIEA